MRFRPWTIIVGLQIGEIIPAIIFNLGVLKMIIDKLVGGKIVVGQKVVGRAT